MQLKDHEHRHKSESGTVAGSLISIYGFPPTTTTERIPIPRLPPEYQIEEAEEEEEARRALVHKRLAVELCGLCLAVSGCQ